MTLFVNTRGIWGYVLFLELASTYVVFMRSMCMGSMQAGDEAKGFWWSTVYIKEKNRHCPSPVELLYTTEVDYCEQYSQSTECIECFIHTSV